MTRIYTRGGDQGETGLFGGDRVRKSDPRISAYGTVDELNSVIGAALAFFPDELQAEWTPKLRLIQEELLTAGSALADPEGETGMELAEGAVGRLEGLIDELQEELPELNNFILPGGSRAGAMLHMARTVCRRAERGVVALAERVDDGVDGRILVYLNRLGDLLFVLARYLNHRSGTDEPVWRGRGES